jgi:tRNA A-37 threonylcarbamoyl transferase component Bud32/tetratricopeptide (TPR) repeat protein
MVGSPTEERALRQKFAQAIAASRLGADPGLLAAVETSLFGDSPWAATSRYRPLRVRGRGAYGTVYEAHDTELDRRVALKVVRRRDADEHPHARMQAEARAIARVSHPNVVQIYDVVWEQGRLQIAMELVQGRDLAHWLSEPRTWQQVVDLLIDVGRGLIAIHDAGLVHRDFKPGNVLVGDDGVPRIADFGLARLLDRGDEITVKEVITESGPVADLTGTGLIVGTPAYMAPEQHAGSRVTEAADQYAFCITLYEALTGQRPFQSSSLRELGEHKLAMRMPRQRPEGVPRAVLAIVRRGLQPDPAARHPSMRALCDALEQARHRRSPKRWLWLAIAGAVGLAAVAIAATREDPCEQGAQAIDAIWNRQRASEIGDAIDGEAFSSASWDSVEARVDAYATRWLASYETACRGSFSPALECLKPRSDDLGSFVELVGEGDPLVLASASEAADALPDPESCRFANDSAWTPPADEAVAVEALRSELARARAEALGGRSERALDRVELVISRADVLRFRAPSLEARVVAGRAERTLGRRDAAAERLEETALEAVAGGFDEIALEAMTLALQCHVESRALDAAELWAEQALSVAARIEAPRREAELETALAVLAWEQRDQEGAIRRLVALLDLPTDVLTAHARYRVLLQLGSYEAERGDDAAAGAWLDRAEKVMRDEDGPDHIAISEIEGRRAMILARRGKLAEGRQHLERARAAIRELPPDHAAVGYTLLREGTLHLLAGEYTDAIEALRPACSVLAADPDAQPVRECFANLASVYGDTGRPDDAIATAKRGLALTEQASAPDHRLVVMYHILIADAERTLGDLATARLEYERALEVIDEHMPGHPRAAWANSRLGDLALDESDLPRAEQHFRTALAQLHEGERAEFGANIRFGLARALGAKDREAALAYAREARALLEGNQSKFAQELSPEIDQWLARRR